MKRELLLTPLPAGKLPPWLLKKVLPVPTRDPQVIVGPSLGADAAAIGIGDRVVVAKNDPITFASQGGEQHLVEVNANDVACMGATPRWLLVTALLPLGVTPADVLRDFANLHDACRQRSVELIGGHTEIVPGLEKPILVGMMLGDAAPDELLEPGQARPGDALLLTKGLAIEGTALLARERADALTALVGETVVENAMRLIDSPGISVVREAMLARTVAGLSALHDPTEGGLATAVREVATISNTGALLYADAIPILPETRLITEALGLDPLGLLASGSLLIAAHPSAAAAIVHAIASAGIPIAPIGVLTDNVGAFEMEESGHRIPLPEFAVDEVARYFASLEVLEEHHT